MAASVRRAATLAAAATLVTTLASLAPAPAQAGPGRFTLALTGAAERPGPGDPDGTGTATFAMKGSGQVCYTITVSAVDPLTSAHIHLAPATDAGAVVLPLPVGSTGGSGCVTAPKALVRAIKAAPDQYYVNVHNATYPAGALRAQFG